MNNIISKLPLHIHQYLRPTFSFPNARIALKAYLQALDLAPDDEIVLPGYIGWSKNEGSGVFDPISEVGTGYRFYQINRDLTINLDSLKTNIQSERARILLIIHYFGFPDPNLKEIVNLARSRGLMIIEDEAHAFYSDYWGGITGRFGDASLISLHKMLPLRKGGLLVLNQPSEDILVKVSRSVLREQLPGAPFDYDLAAIAVRRRENAECLLEKVRLIEPNVSVLFSSLPEGVVPQTLPVLIHHYSRDKLYFQMNELGYGVVSLYHTLIQQLETKNFPDSHWLSQRILNLPVHQDTSRASLTSMIECMQTILD